MSVFNILVPIAGPLLKAVASLKRSKKEKDRDGAEVIELGKDLVEAMAEATIELETGGLLDKLPASDQRLATFWIRRTVRTAQKIVEKGAEIADTEVNIAQHWTDTLVEIGKMLDLAKRGSDAEKTADTLINHSERVAEGIRRARE